MQHVSEVIKPNALEPTDRSPRQIYLPPDASTSAADPPKCKKCDGVGYLNKYKPVGDPEFGEIFLCDCQLPEVAARAQQASGVRPQEREGRLADIEVRGRPGTALMTEACQEFVRRPAGMLTLWGGVGNGKTMALQAVVNELTASAVAAVYVTAFDLLSDIKQGFNAPRDAGSEDAYLRLKRFEEVRVLALDEFDKINQTTWAMEALTDLIDRRYRFGFDGPEGTLLAMNSDPTGLPDWLRSRLTDGRNRVVHNEDGDLRPALER